MILPDGSQIDVFDDVFPLAVRTQIYAKTVNANFRIGWEDMGLLERGSYDYHLHAQFPDELMAEMGVFEHLAKNPEIMKLIGGLKLKGTYINLTFATEAYFVHHDMSGKTILYYIHPEWKDGWGGETVFWSNDMSEIVYASPYVPGRVIIFDGHIPHSVRPQSMLGPKYRFSMAMMMTAAAAGQNLTA